MSSVLEKLMARTWPWAVGATLMVFGFMIWLYAESSSLGTGDVVADTTVSAVPMIADTAFIANPQAYYGRRILITPVKVEELLGRAAVLVTVADTMGYPLILDRPVFESEMTIIGGDNLSIAGWVYALNDSLLNVYAQRGLFEPEQREKLEGKSTFFLVDSLDFVFPEETGGAPGM
jgi:hypothetical protein